MHTCTWAICLGLCSCPWGPHGTVWRYWQSHSLQLVSIDPDGLNMPPLKVAKTMQTLRVAINMSLLYLDCCEVGTTVLFTGYKMIWGRSRMTQRRRSAPSLKAVESKLIRELDLSWTTWSMTTPLQRRPWEPIGMHAVTTSSLFTFGKIAVLQAHNVLKCDAFWVLQRRICEMFWYFFYGFYLKQSFYMAVLMLL